MGGISWSKVKDQFKRTGDNPLVNAVVPGFSMLTGGNFLGQRGRSDAANDINAGYDAAREKIGTSYPQARTRLNNDVAFAKNDASTGFAKARESYGKGLTAAQGNMQDAKGDVTAGYGAAKGLYQTPEIATSRQQLYQMMLGKGGLDDSTINKMKAGAREEYGAAARDIKGSYNPMRGDASAPGLEDEAFAEQLAALGAKRAVATRDIDIENARLAEEQQQFGIEGLYGDAGEQSGLFTDEAGLLAGLDSDLAGINLQGGAGLAGIDTAETNLLNDLSMKLASGNMDLTTEEAQLLAQLAAGQGAAMAGTRDTQGMMPILGGLSQGLGAGLGASMGKG